MHVAKNFLELPKIKVPLILGIWGGKGQGKTFQCTLAYKKLGINPVVMSAGELESGNAGEPAKLIRQRYRSVVLPYSQALQLFSHCSSILLCPVSVTLTSHVAFWQPFIGCILLTVSTC